MAPVAGRDSAIALVLFKDHVISCTEVLNSARYWARHGRRVDILAFDTGLFPRPVLGEGVRLLFVQTLYARLLPLWRRFRATGVPGTPPAAETGNLSEVVPQESPSIGRSIFRSVVATLRSFQKIEFFLAHTWRLSRGGYDCIFVYDTVSLLVARSVNLLRGTPYVYHPRELSLSWDLRGLGHRAAKWMERRCHRHALFTVAQDRTRAAMLCRDNGVPPESFMILPNAPLGSWPGGSSAYLHRRLGLPQDTPIVLYAGGVTPETMVLEVIESIVDWPAGPVLVVHGPPQTTYLPALRAAAAPFPGRVWFSTVFIPLEEVDDLFASATVGVAFYRPIDDNFRYVGHAAAKIFNLMKVGVPVVTNDLPGMRQLIEDNGCGRVVDGPARLGDALRQILAEPGRWREPCRETFTRFEFSRNFAEVVRRVEAVITPTAGSMSA